MSTPIVRRRKKPVEVDTIQWTGTNVDDVIAFTGGDFLLVDPGEGLAPEITAKVYDELHSTWVLVYTGQHIVRGVKGELYPIAEDVLADTYEPADIPLPTARRAEAFTEGARLLEDAACDADWEKSPDFCAGLRAGAELLLAKTGEATAAAATATPTDTNRRARLLTEISGGGRWKSGDVVAWYGREGLTGLGAHTARRDLAALRDSGAITQHDEKGVRFYTLTPTRGGAR